MFIGFSTIVLFIAITLLCLFFIFVWFTKAPQQHKDDVKRSMKTIIFDFDGTIANTREILLKSINQCAPKYGYPKISYDDYEKFKNQDIYTTIHQLNISLLKLPFIIKDIKKSMHTSMEQTKPYDGIKNILQELKDNNYRLVIVTSNSIKNVKLFLHANKLDFFDSLYTTQNIFSKDQTLAHVLKKLTLTSTEALYIGDEIRDVKGAKKNSLLMIGVSWGYNTPEVLQKAGADVVVTTPAELYSTIRSLTDVQ